MIRILCALLLVPHIALAAEGILYLSPEQSTYGVGDVFEIELYADTGGEAIMAAEAEVVFDPRLLRVVSLDTSESLLTSWATEPTYSNTDGRIQLSGWVGSRPFIGSRGRIATIAFEAQTASAGAITLASGSLLSRDNQGTNILALMRSAAVRVEPRALAAEPVPTAAREPEPIVAGASIQPPEIRVETFMRAGERLIVEGTAQPLSEVRVYFARGDERPREGVASAGQTGAITFASTERLEPGTYRVWAESKVGTEVLRSEVLSIQVSAQTALAAVAFEKKMYVCIALGFLPLLLFFVYRRRSAHFAKEH